jgi:hypothetical protein
MAAVDQNRAATKFVCCDRQEVFAGAVAELAEGVEWVHADYVCGGAKGSRRDTCAGRCHLVARQAQ